nr:unnamed protein product [Digitaria exilis]
MNSPSATSLSSVSGARHTSSAIAPPPPRPSKTDVLPSIMFPGPLRTANGFPHPKSFPYTSNRGELPVPTAATVSISALYASLGSRAHRVTELLTMASSSSSTNDATARFNSRAAAPSPAVTSPAVDHTLQGTTAFPTYPAAGTPFTLPRHPISSTYAVSCDGSSRLARHTARHRCARRACREETTTVVTSSSSRRRSVPRQMEEALVQWWVVVVASPDGELEPGEREPDRDEAGVVEPPLKH